MNRIAPSPDQWNTYRQYVEERFDRLENRITILETKYNNDIEHKMRTLQILSILGSIAATILGAILSKIL